MGTTTLAHSLAHTLAHHIPANNEKYAVLLVSLHCCDPAAHRSGKQPTPHIGEWLTNPKPEKLSGFIHQDLGRRVGILTGFPSPNDCKRLWDGRNHKELIDAMKKVASWLVFDVPSTHVLDIMPLSSQSVFVSDTMDYGRLGVVLTNDWLVRAGMRAKNIHWVLRMRERQGTKDASRFVDGIHDLWANIQISDSKTLPAFLKPTPPTLFWQEPDIVKAQSQNELPIRCQKLGQTAEQLVQSWMVQHPVVVEQQQPAPAFA